MHACRFLENICVIAKGERVNASGINVLVTKSGSITKALFPAYCAHFVNKHLPKHQGKGGEPDPSYWCSMGMHPDGTTRGSRYLLDHNVYCLFIPGHASIWA